MAVFVLVPGMWHGGWCWKKVTPLLRASGHEVYAITLTGVGERSHLRYPDIDLNTHVQDVAGVLEYEDLYGVILVGHSLGGIMAPAIAERIPQRVAHVVNLDGILPTSGKSFKEMLPNYWAYFFQLARDSGDSWWAPPPDWDFGVAGTDLEWLKSRLTTHPLKSWETPLYFNGPAAQAVPHTFIHCTNGVSPEEIANQEKACSQLGWQYRTLATGHDAMITAPEGLVEILLELV